MRILPNEEMMYPASALPNIKRRAVKEFAEKLKEKYPYSIIHPKTGLSNSLTNAIDNLITELYGADE